MKAEKGDFLDSSFPVTCLSVFWIFPFGFFVDFDLTLGVFPTAPSFWAKFIGSSGGCFLLSVFSVTVDIETRDACDKGGVSVGFLFLLSVRYILLLTALAVSSFSELESLSLDSSSLSESSDDDEEEEDDDDEEDVEVEDSSSSSSFCVSFDELMLDCEKSIFYSSSVSER